jgi:hypothetical protein
MQEHYDLAAPCALDDLYDHVRGGGSFRCGVYPVDMECMHWCENLAASQPNLAFAVDEYSVWYQTPTSLPSNGFQALVRCGRKLHQSVYLTTQSPGCINKIMCDQGAIWVLPMQGVNDRKYIMARTQDEIDPADLKPVETDGKRIIRTQVALYADGIREDFILHTPTATLEPATTPCGESTEIAAEDPQDIVPQEPSEIPLDDPHPDA